MWARGLPGQMRGDGDGGERKNTHMGAGIGARNVRGCGRERYLNGMRNV